MLFNSYPFLFAYLPIVLFGFFAISRFSHRLAALWLAAASLFFYGWWNPGFVLLLVASVCFNFLAGYGIGHQRSRQAPDGRRKALLALAVAANLLLLGYFKYTNFFIATTNQLAGTHWSLADIVLPLGISFFTFTQIAFLVDVHRGIARDYNLIHYLLFVTYFPHLIAGPVLHHKQMMPQFDHPATYSLNVRNLNVGLTVFVIGLFKKVILADQFALYANPVFDGVAGGMQPGMVEAWVGAVGYTLQLYFDFSGYSDMAIGLSMMFNVRLPLNFDSPYKATSIIDFWRRWHMTLSIFLRDYLYIPLGGNRHGSLRRYGNLLVTMLLGGLWHGASWTFVLWGGLHGVFLIINHAWRTLRRRLRLPRVPGGTMIAGAITFVAVVLAWVVFRASTFDVALRLTGAMFTPPAGSLPESFEGLLPSLVAHQPALLWGFTSRSSVLMATLAWYAAGLLVVWGLPNAQQWLSLERRARSAEVAGASAASWQPTRTTAVLVGSAFAIAVLAFKQNSPFLYFQF